MKNIYFNVEKSIKDLQKIFENTEKSGKNLPLFFMGKPVRGNQPLLNA